LPCARVKRFQADFREARFDAAEVMRKSHVPMALW
jgi:hypothetical protein